MDWKRRAEARGNGGDGRAGKGFSRTATTPSPTQACFPVEGAPGASGNKRGCQTDPG